MGTQDRRFSLYISILDDSMPLLRERGSGITANTLFCLCPQMGVDSPHEKGPPTRRSSSALRICDMKSLIKPPVCLAAESVAV